MAAVSHTGLLAAGIKAIADKLAGHRAVPVNDAGAQ